MLDAMEVHNIDNIKVLSAAMNNNERAILRSLVDEWRRTEVDNHSHRQSLFPLKGSSICFLAAVKEPQSGHQCSHYHFLLTPQGLIKIHRFLCRNPLDLNGSPQSLHQPVQQHSSAC